MATFTKVTGGATHEPLFVFDIQPEREVRNIEHDLLHSATTRGAFVPTANRSGSFKCRYASHADALSGMTYFGAATLFLYVGTDSSFNMRFMVVGGPLRPRQSQDPDLWDLDVSFKEFPA